MKYMRPELYMVLLREMAHQLVEAAATLIRGVPLAHGMKWPINEDKQERVLEQLARLKGEGVLFLGVDNQALNALAARLRITHWQIHTKVVSKGQPMPCALIILDGQLTGFRLPGGAPTAIFNKG